MRACINACLWLIWPDSSLSISTSRASSSCQLRLKRPYWVGLPLSGSSKVSMVIDREVDSELGTGGLSGGRGRLFFGHGRVLELRGVWARQRHGRRVWRRCDLCWPYSGAAPVPWRPALLTPLSPSPPPYARWTTNAERACRFQSPTNAAAELATTGPPWQTTCPASDYGCCAGGAGRRESKCPSG